MRAKGAWTIKSFFTCFVLNAVLVGGVFFMARYLLLGFHQWIDPFVSSGAAPVPDDIRSALAGLQKLINETELYLAPAVLGGGGLVTLVLWLTLLIQGRGLVNRAQREVGALPPQTAQAPAEGKTSAGKQRETPPEPQYTQQSPQAAVQMLSILQREGRLVDFLQEDLSLYEDSQIGAAVRSIHQGCKAALTEHVKLQPIFDEGEGSEVVVPQDFDSRAIRLTGSVTGSPPFKGTLRHRGWKVARVELPQPTSEQKKDWVLAPAEVEVGE